MEKNIEWKCNVDIFDFKDNHLSIAGWIFHEEFKLENIKLKVIGRNTNISENIVYGVKRLDVFEQFKSENAKLSGFVFNSQLKTNEKLYVYLEFSINGIYYKQLLNIVQYSWKNKLKKINRKNIYKFFKYLKAGTLKNVLYNIKQTKLELQEDLSYGIDFAEFLRNNSADKMDFDRTIFYDTIDIIIPIYNGYEYFEKLFSSIEKTAMKYRLFLVNDKSTDERVDKFLKEYAEQSSETIVINNSENLGFVKSVNKALKLTENHVALVNSDVELPEQWLERLMYPIIMQEKVASSTPFTNCGTICSFPRFAVDNEIFEGMPLAHIDKVFQLIKPRYAEMPTGVGFCMGMNKEALRKVGFLDEESFSKGYGEENDWCQRAIEAGYKNVHVENLYVYHKHGGSFLSEEKKKLLKRNGKILLNKHPNYNKDVAEYCEKDINKDIREYILLKLLLSMDDTKVNLAFNHNLGGGATSYLEKRKREDLEFGSNLLVVKYDVNISKYRLEYEKKGYKIEYSFEEIEVLESIITDLKVNSIYVNELVTYPNIYDLLDEILKCKKQYKLQVIYLLHDFYSLCPGVNLIDFNGKYCDLPEGKKCENCAKNNQTMQYLESQSMKTWRENWGMFLSQCTQIIVFSKNSEDILKKVYNDLENIVLIPHKVSYIEKLERRNKITSTLNIGLLGVLSKHKGLDIVKEMLQIIENRKLNINIVLIGSSQEEIHNSHFIEVGEYTFDMLPKLILKNDIDIFMISSVWPETFSFTTEEIMQLQYPIASFNLGAPAERIRKYDKGLVIDKINAQAAIDQIVNFADSYIQYNEGKKVLILTEYITFSSRYRGEHLGEELLFQGVDYDFVELAGCEMIDASQYECLVIYRAIQNDKLSELIAKFHSQNKMVFYDIDDYIFNFEQIKSLEFLKDPEYKGFEQYCNNILKCMKQADAFITSTENMKEAIEKDFPQKEVLVNRNVASMEMYMISQKAKTEIKKDENRIILGYFSGSKTHDADFELISDVLLDILENHPKVCLELGGCLNLDERFMKYEKRIEKFDFIDWKQLPYKIAKIDINLMPLEDTFFHTCKSENKWMEAALVEVPTVASYNSELELVIKNGENGFLCKTKQEWKKTLEEMIFSSELRQDLAAKANSEVKERYCTAKSGIQVTEFLMKKRS